MSNKVPIERVESVLEERIPDQDLRNEILEEIRQALEPRAEPQPRPETRDVTILIGAQEALDAIDEQSIYAFTVQIDAEADHNTLLEHLVNKAREHNATRRRGRITRLGQVFDSLKPKKDLDQFPKRIYTKESALILKTTNLPVSAPEAEE